MEVAARFLPLVARERLGDLRPVAVRCLARWAQEMAGTIDDVVDIAVPLAELPKGPCAVEELGNLFTGGRPG